MVLPASATGKRGAATVGVGFPDKSAVVIGATLTLLSSKEGKMLRVDFEPLTKEHVKRIEDQLHITTGVRRTGGEDARHEPSAPSAPAAPVVDSEPPSIRARAVLDAELAPPTSEVPSYRKAALSASDAPGGLSQHERREKIHRLVERARYYQEVGLHEEYVKTLHRILDLAPEDEHARQALAEAEASPSKPTPPDEGSAHSSGLHGMFGRIFGKD